ncbi:uncharacterized protein LOC111614519, partial [Centruroides sculpturatus]|uniref:uncharacterized protein LOC111614519 n=1 Tax=Centruroides sculpturatus TaxID=218467 RepID=UPI000C6E8FC6
MAEIGHGQLPKFTGSNFTSWKYRIMAILESRDLGNLLIDDPPTDPAEEAKWKKTDSQARGILTCAMDDTQVALILTCKTTKQIWTHLRERYEGDLRKQAIEARNNVARLVMNRDETWRDYLLRGEKLLESARIMGAQIEDDEFITALLRGLPQKYNLIAMQFDNLKDPKISDVRKTFERYEERNGLEQRENLTAYRAYHPPNYKTPKDNAQRKSRTRETLCYICRKPNHKAIECWLNPINKARNRDKRDNIDLDNRRSNFKTSKIAWENSARVNDNRQRKEKPTNEGNNRQRVMTLSTNGEPDTCWIIDSGATSHMTPNRQWLENMREDTKT